MAEAWTDLDDSDLAQDKPLRQSIVRALRDNVEGLAAGVSGAPKIQTAAIAASAVTTTKLESGERMTAANVGSSYAGLNADAIGSVAFARRLIAGSDIGVGDTSPGSTLAPANAAGNIQNFNFSGTWKCLGFCDASGGTVEERSTLWLRIS